MDALVTRCLKCGEPLPLNLEGCMRGSNTRAVGMARVCMVCGPNMEAACLKDGRDGPLAEQNRVASDLALRVW
jgi:hypothetical protein